MVVGDADVPEHVRAFLRRVIEGTGYRVAIEETELLEFDSEVRYASQEGPIHHIRISRAFRDHRAHFILSSLAKIDRYFSTPTSERRLPVINANGRLPAPEEATLRRLGMPELLVAEVSNRLYVGLARQLLSFPLDLRVEQELYGSYPEHQERQLLYLKRQVLDIEAHFSPEIEAVSPPETYAASSAMNCAFAEFCSGLTGERPPRDVRYSRHRVRGEELLHELDGLAHVAGHLGDREAQDAWARILGLRELYEWTGG